MERASAQSAGLAALIPSGIDPIDREWGGLYRGGAYLVFGRAASGRGLLNLRYVMTGVDRRERCLFIASDRPKDLMIQAASIGFDLRKAQKAGFVRLMRIPPMLNLQSMGDEAVAKALWDLVALVRREKPDRIVINDFMPFVMFRSFDRFRMEFVRMLEQFDSLESTAILALPEPANQQSRRVIEFMAGQMTGSMHVELEDDDPGSTVRRLTLIPHIGQIKRQSVESWDLAGLTQGAGTVSIAGESTIEFGQYTQVDPAEGISEAPRPSVSAPGVSKTGSGENVEHRYADRDAFRLRLQRHFEGRDAGARPFLLLAMRMDRSGGKTTRPFDFEFIIDLVADTLRTDDDMLIGATDERLVVLLADSRPEEAQGFFARLKNRLRAEAPDQADHLLHAVSAIVVPDGRPFQSAEEFLAYALDEA